KNRSVVAGIQALELGSAIRHFAHLNIPTSSLLSLKLENLLVKEEAMERKKGQKMADLLSRDFLHYAKYGGEKLSEWKEKGGRQQTLFDQAFEGWDIPLKLDEVDVKPARGAEIHLFAIPFMPQVYHRFFSRLAEVCEVYFYELSPCRMFMADLYSEWEKGRMGDGQYLEGHHPLLANLGRVSREKFKVFEEADLIELYEEEGLTLLQRDLLDDVLEAKGGGEVHQATSRQREVEIIYAEIVPLLAKYKPSDIAIFAPDIHLYAPFIHLIFGSKIPYSMTDLEGHHPLIDMLELDDRRWDVESVFALLPSRFLGIKEWVEEEGVRWGLNEAHRKELLGPQLLEEGGRGTWEEALQKLIRSVAENSVVEFSKVELLAEFWEFLQKLKREKGEMTLGEWTRYFKEFYPDFEGIGDLEGITFPLESVKRHFMKFLKRKNGSYGMHQKEAVHFSSLKLGSVAPYPIVIMMGMNQGEFPRVEVARSLSEIKGEFAPTVNDEDRHALLELLGSVREKWIMTYVETPSPVLELLMRSLDIQPKVHPPFAFHKSYIHHLVSEQTAQAASSYYGKKEAVPFIPEFLKGGGLKQGEVSRIPVPSLIRLMKHPLKFYCHEQLKLYLEEKQVTGGEFTLSHLDKYKMKRNQLNEAVLPHGLYKEIACTGVEEGFIRKIELNPYCQKKIELPDRVVFPSLRVRGVVFEGVFEFEENSEDSIKHFAQNVLMTALGEGEWIKNSDQALEWLVTYYSFAKENMSPLHPNWAEPFLMGDQEKVGKEIESAVASGGFTDPYVELVFKNKKNYSVPMMMDTWETVLAPLREWI
nr:exodeoxyribonuclease V subunit gamma [Simkaniaceae bacterium]